MKLNKSYIYCWVTALLVYLINRWKLNKDLTSSLSSTEDLLENTYFFDHSYHFIMVTTIPFIVMGLIYWIYEKLKLSLNKRLTRIHLVISIVGILLFLYVSSYLNGNIMAGLRQVNFIIEVIAIFILIAQLLFLINLLSGIFKGKKEAHL